MRSQLAQKESRDAATTADKAQLIQKRAYELYLKRGKKSGHELEDWLEAEREISARRFDGGR